MLLKKSKMVPSRSPKTVNIRLATYNVLSPDLATPTEHRHCKSKNLDTETRFKRVVKQLKKEMKQNSIICLQELVQEWAEKLKPIMESNKYFFFEKCYKVPLKGRRGVAVAVPTEIYSVLEVESQQVVETVHWPSQEGFVGDMSTLGSQEVNDIRNARLQKNPAIWCKVRDKYTQTVFCFATYHMPMVRRSDLTYLPLFHLAVL